MTASVDSFAANCAAVGRVTIVGPLLDIAPTAIDSPRLYVDGGARWYEKIATPTKHAQLSLGDGDSLAAQTLDIQLNTRKNASDLECALDLLPMNALHHITLIGFLGGRRDHEWINFGVTANAMASSRQLRADFDTLVSILSPGQYRFNRHGIFSLVHFTIAQTRIRGAVDYPLDTPTTIAPFTSFGLSNRSFGEFEISSDAVCLCFWPAPE